MKKSHDPISELKDFVRHQAAEDAVLAPVERRYQAELVKDVLMQEQLKPTVFKSLWGDYSRNLTAHIKH